MAEELSRGERETLPGPVRLQFDLDHEFGQCEPWDLKPGSGWKLLRVNGVTTRGNLEKFRRVGRIDVLGDQIVEGIAVVLQSALP